MRHDGASWSCHISDTSNWHTCTQSCVLNLCCPLSYEPRKPHEKQDLRQTAGKFSSLYTQRNPPQLTQQTNQITKKSRQLLALDSLDGETVTQCVIPGCTNRIRAHCIDCQVLGSNIKPYRNVSPGRSVVSLSDCILDSLTHDAYLQAVLC